MILDEFGNGRIGCNLRPRRLKVDLLILCAVLLDEVNRISRVHAEIRTIVDVYAYVNLVLPQPVFLRELISRQQLELLPSSGPPVEKVSAPTLRRNQHVIQTLPVSVAIEPRVLRNRAEDRSGIHLVFVGQMYCDSLLIQIVRGRLGNDGIDIDVLVPKRK